MPCQHETILHKEVYRCRACGQTWPHDGHDVPPGPGTAIYDALHAMGVPDCPSCKARAFQMDIWGIEGCKDKLDVIVGWMRYEASRAISTRRLDDTIRTFVQSHMEG